ncbi:MAG: Type 1 glutamine amidotransferase-like domain-containing protein [Eubacteriales bacterium]|nr:Type 1 glutamine amidotransferase-like domain-containing protein [Eubacteriales bacterium]
MNVLLTCAGLATPGISQTFLAMLGKPVSACSALFIPTAAITPDAIDMLPKCLADLTTAGIPRSQITVYDLHRPMTEEELLAFDVVYVCGGSTPYLLERMKEVGFAEILSPYLRAEKVYLGVSAGSVVAAANLPGSLGLIKSQLRVHCPIGSPCADYDPAFTGVISLTNTQAIALRTCDCQIIS